MSVCLWVCGLVADFNAVFLKISDNCGMILSYNKYSEIFKLYKIMLPDEGKVADTGNCHFEQVPK